MTGFRASTLRKTCKHCKTTFKPKRADAEFCCGLCRQAAHHRRNKAVSAARAVDVFAKRYKEGLEAIDQFDRYQSLAGTLHVKARDLNINIRYMAVRGIGILAADAGEGWGAFMFAKKKLLPPWWRPIQTVRSDSPEVTALLSLPTLAGGSFLAREAEREFRDALSCSVVDVSVFVEDWEHFRENSEAIALPPALPTWPTTDYVDVEIEDYDDAPISPLYDGDLTDGFQVIDSSHQAGRRDE
ncbi:hypothetical protein [Bradyrhizobium japonicum]|uniref:hypothetical protein n=1 Tax=Bradyrhizobium japonicum TaxID=375 RepID=UPI002714E506|nr:hypothetical protein [Bradyrhizobium japonicum]WLB18929.1 hypothetical protein QIH95_44620 [Bradyrhizobium japonicum]